jgi:RNA polymerase sigma-70 factor
MREWSDPDSDSGHTVGDPAATEVALCDGAQFGDGAEEFRADWPGACARELRGSDESADDEPLAVGAPAKTRVGRAHPNDPAPSAPRPQLTLVPSQPTVDDRLVAIFLARTRCKVARPELLGEALARKLEEARGRWPMLEVDAEELVGILAEKLSPKDNALEGLERLRSEDLFLVHAILRSNPIALEAFERTVLADVGAFIRHLSPSAEVVDEVTQRVRIKLLTANDSSGVPKITSYSGRHPLRNWVCTVSVRTAIDMHRSRRRETSEEEADVLQATNNPELSLLRARYQTAFARALAVASRGIEVGQRRLMRLFFQQGFTYRQIGRIFNVDETTARRRVLQARELLTRRVRAELERELKLRKEEIEPLFALFQSRMDVNLSRLFASIINHPE